MIINIQIIIAFNNSFLNGVSCDRGLLAGNAFVVLLTDRTSILDELKLIDENGETLIEIAYKNKFLEAKKIPDWQLRDFMCNQKNHTDLNIAWKQFMEICTKNIKEFSEDKLYQIYTFDAIMQEMKYKLYENHALDIKEILGRVSKIK
jgi:hypothetical protein